MDKKNTLAENLIYQRKLKGFSQKELSDRTNVTVRTIQRIEKGDTEPHLQTVKMLAAALEIEVNELLILDDPKEEDIQKKWLLLMHATPFIGFVVPLANIFLPLFLWIHKREDNKLYAEHGRRIVNFQISMVLFFVLGMVFFFMGNSFINKNFPLIWFLVAIIAYAAIVMIVNIFTAVAQQRSYYPLSIPFIRKWKSKTSAKTVAVLIFCTAFSAPGSAQEFQRLDGTTISRDSLSNKIEQLMTDAGVTGMGFTLFNNDEKVFSQAFGWKQHEGRQPLNDSTNIYGASLSKAVFSVIVMKMVEEEVIDLDTPLESYLPKKIWQYEPETRWHDDYTDLREDSLYHRITARMALAHTSGFPNWRFIEPDKKLRVKLQPGSRYLYSGEGMVYLQVVLEKITGKGLEEMATEIVFNPLQMNNTSYTWQSEFEDDYANGHTKDGRIIKKDIDNEARAPSTLETTLADYNKFLLAALNEKIISRESWKEIFSPQIRIRSRRQFGPMAMEDGPLNDDIELSYGLGWGWFQTPYGKAVFKEGSGSGFHHYSILFPEAKKGVLIMTNSFNGGSIFKELLEVAIRDVYTPWEWNNYIPYDQQ